MLPPVGWLGHVNPWGSGVGVSDLTNLIPMDVDNSISSTSEACGEEFLHSISKAKVASTNFSLEGRQASMISKYDKRVMIRVTIREL